MNEMMKRVKKYIIKKVFCEKYIHIYNFIDEIYALMMKNYKKI